MTQASQWGWSDVATKVAASAPSCNCAKPLGGEYPPAERRVDAGISRLFCLFCGGVRNHEK